MATASAGKAALGLSFAGGGFLGIYHLGALKCLVEHGRSWLMKVDRFAGASSGALVAAVTALGTEVISLPNCTDFVFHLAADTHKKKLGAFTPGTNILVPLAEYLSRELPPDAHLLLTGRLYVSVTNLQTRRNELVSDFQSRDELIKYLLASCYIPGFTGFEAPVVGKKKYMDGGITMNLPTFADCRTVYVSPFCGRVDICPLDDKVRGPFVSIAGQDVQLSSVNFMRMIQALWPPSIDELNNYYERGYGDAKRFLVTERAYEKSLKEAGPTEL